MLIHDNRPHHRTPWGRCHSLAWSLTVVAMNTYLSQLLSEKEFKAIVLVNGENEKFLSWVLFIETYEF